MGVYIATLIWYPAFLTIKIGTIDFSATRILIMVLFLKILITPNLLNNFEFILIDKIMLVFAGCTLLAGLNTTDPGQAVEYWGGGVFDSILPYFAVRFIIFKKEDYVKLLVRLIIISSPLAIVGLYQCFTGNNPFGFFYNYNAFLKPENWITSEIMRMGFFRANVTFSVSIMFGMYFAILLGLYIGVIDTIRTNKVLVWVGVAIVLLGGMSSMSSGPFLAIIIVISISVFFYFRMYIKMILTFIVVCLTGVDLYSDRHWYHVASRFTFSEGTAYYRIHLIEIALGGGMNSHWLFGYGLADPGWGEMLSGQQHTDIVNEFIMILVSYGLVGLLPYIILLVMAFMQIRKASNMTKTVSEKKMIWGMYATLFGILLSSFSVSLFGPTKNFYFMFLGFCASAPMWMQNRTILNCIRSNNNTLWSLKYK